MLPAFVCLSSAYSQWHSPCLLPASSTPNVVTEWSPTEILLKKLEIGPVKTPKRSKACECRLVSFQQKKEKETECLELQYLVSNTSWSYVAKVPHKSNNIMWLDHYYLFFLRSCSHVLYTSVKYCCVLGLPATSHHLNAGSTVKQSIVQFSSSGSVFSCVSLVWRCLALPFRFCCCSRIHSAHLDLCSCHRCSVMPCSGKQSQPAWSSLTLVWVLMWLMCISAALH